MKYNQYLQTNHWQSKRSIALQHPHCRLCGNEKFLQLHHKLYKRSKSMRTVKIGLRKAGSILFDEQGEDLILLCASCHKMWHAQFGKLYMDKHYIIKIRKLMKLGIKKNIAFHIAVKQKDLWPYIYKHLKNHSVDKNLYNFDLFVKNNEDKIAAS